MLSARSYAQLLHSAEMSSDNLCTGICGLLYRVDFWPKWGSILQDAIMHPGEEQGGFAA